MESGYLCEILDFLMRERHGTPLVKLPVDLVEVDNEASLDLLCALFKHCECHEKCYDLHCRPSGFFFQIVISSREYYT